MALLSQKGDRARVLSGGTDLIVQVREKRRDLDLMMDVKRIPKLAEVRSDATGLTLADDMTSLVFAFSSPLGTVFSHPLNLNFLWRSQEASNLCNDQWQAADG